MPNSDRSARYPRIRLALLLVVTFLVGLSIGARAFMNTQPRSWLNIGSCASRCYRPSDLARAMASGLTRYSRNFMCRAPSVS